MRKKKIGNGTKSLQTNDENEYVEISGGEIFISPEIEIVSRNKK